MNNSFASRAEVDTALFWIPQAKYVRIPDGPPGSTKNFPIPESGSLICGERREALVPGVELLYESVGDARRKF